MSRVAGLSLMNQKEAGDDAFSCPRQMVSRAKATHVLSLGHKGVVFRFLHFLFYLSEQILSDGL